ncbi:hypothetical protein AAE478_002430 [Parahypoxylon ruwenzoriense]
MDSDDERRGSASDTGSDDVSNGDTVASHLTRSQTLNLYVSHAFSMWNARGYEFAAILFTAAAYPDTLVAAALRQASPPYPNPFESAC